MKTWTPGMSDKETADIAYWERNMLALLYADGWYNDDVPAQHVITEEYVYYSDGSLVMTPRLMGWRRVLSLHDGAATFHIPDDFDVMGLPQMEPNWDGHTTEEKWTRIAGYVRLKWSKGNEL